MEGQNICSSAIVGEVLKGHENYENWRACIKNYLWVRDLWDVVEETASEPSKQDEADLKAWQKRNVSALHAIEISCAPNLLSVIRDKTTAKDAWNTLGQMCQPPPMPDQNAQTQPVGNVVERAEVLAFLNFIKIGDLERTKRQMREKPDLINANILSWGRRMPLHFAITVENLEMIEELLSYMSEEEVKMQDSFGRTALHFAAMSPGNTKTASRLIRKNKELLFIQDSNGYIPLNYACLAGHKDMSHYLYNMTTPAFLLLPQNQNHCAQFAIRSVGSKLFDVALDLLQRSPELAIAYHNRWNAVSELSSLPSAFPSHSGLLFWQRRIYSFERKLLGLWSNLLKFFGIKQIYDLKLIHVSAYKLLLLMSKMIAGLDALPNSVIEAIHNASRRWITEFIVEIIKTNPDLLVYADNDHRNIFQIAVLHRQEKVFSIIYGIEAMKYDLPTYADKYDNNMLHLAGKLEPVSQLKLDQISGAALQMQRELQWFKEVESIVPPAYKEYRNQAGETPYETFDRSHADLLKRGEQWMKDIAQSSTIVGTLIITIMFAALFTVPGGNNQDTGFPLLLKKKLFKLFIISDAIALFASSTSVLMFVGILSSRYSKDDFLTSLPTKLIIGLSALFISIAAMMVAFCSTVIIMVKGQLEIVIPIVLLAAIPVGLFVWLQFPLLVSTFISTYRPGIFDRKMKKLL